MSRFKRYLRKKKKARAKKWSNSLKICSCNRMTKICWMKGRSKWMIRKSKRMRSSKSLKMTLLKASKTSYRISKNICMTSRMKVRLTSMKSSLSSCCRMLIISQLSSRNSCKLFWRRDASRRWSLRRSSSITIFTIFWLRTWPRLRFVSLIWPILLIVVKKMIKTPSNVSWGRKRSMSSLSKFNSTRKRPSKQTKQTKSDA